MTEPTQQPDVSGHLEADGSVSFADRDAFGCEIQTESPPELSEQQIALEAERDGYHAEYGYAEGGEPGYEGNYGLPEYEDAGYGPGAYDPIEEMVAGAIEQEFAPLYDEYGLGAEHREPEPTVGEVVADAVADTTISPQQQAAWDQMIEQQPELNHPVVLEVLEPILGEIAEQHGLDAAVHPTTDQGAFQAIGGPDAFRGQIEEHDIVQGDA